MNWEAFWGALLPSILTLLAALATYYKAKAAASSSVDASASATGAHVAADARLGVALRIEQKLDAVIAAQNDGGVKMTPPSPSPSIQSIAARIFP